MFNAYILSGSNLDQPLQQLAQAQKLLTERCGTLLSASAVYTSPPWGYTEQPHFLNQALVLSTAMEPETLMAALLQIEQDMGRVRARHMGPRRIDLDLLLVDQQVCDTPLLLLPHPRLAERRFALTPLAEIAPQLCHPILQQTMAQLLEQCSDPSVVYKFSEAMQ